MRLDMRLDMRLCDGDAAVEQTAESAASSCRRDAERLDAPDCSCHQPPADDDRWLLLTTIYLLMKHNQNRELIDFSFNLEPSVTKLVCVRTSSKGYVPTF